MIYFDNAATSPVDAEVLDAMLPYLREEYGNPSSKYYCLADNARNAVEFARENVARLLGASPEEIVFTSGATESTNFIIKSYMDYRKHYGDGKNHIITSTAEHKATLNVCRFLNGEIYSNNDATVSLFGTNPQVNRGYSVTFVPVDSTGRIQSEMFKDAFNDNTALASIIYVNNEIGTVNDVESLIKFTHRNNAVFHIDATQAVGKIPIDVHGIQCDFLSMSAHKLYGPKGIGCAYMKADKYGKPPISSLIHGGEQENGLRAGTLAVHNIVGFGKAAEIALRDMQSNIKIVDELDFYLTSRLDSITDISIIADEVRAKGILSLLVDRVNFNNERFIKRISDEIALSTGSACSLSTPSHVIEAIGLQEKVSKILRISINKYTTRNDIDCLISLLQ